MTFRRLLVLGAIASCILLAAGVDARADYSYTTSLVTASAVPATLGEQITSLSSTITPSVPAGPAFVNLTYNPTTTITGATQTLSWTETLNNLPGGPAGTFAISGTLNIISATPGAVLATFTNVTITPTSSAGFTLSFIGYAAQNSTGTNANISFGIVPTAAIPEPTSLALLGTGLIGVVGLGMRRSRTMAKA